MDLFLSILAKAGYVLAIVLWRPLGPKYFGPIVVVLSVDLIGMSWKYFGLPWDTVLTPMIMAGYHILLLFWVVHLSRVFKDNVGYAAATVALLVVTMQVSLIPPLDRSDPNYYILLTTEMMTVLKSMIAIVIVSVFIWWMCQADYRRGLVKKFQEGKRLMILDKASRILIPLLIWSILVPTADMLKSNIPESLYAQRNLISSYCLGWGWVLLYFRAGWEREVAGEEIKLQSRDLISMIKRVTGTRQAGDEQKPNTKD